MKNKPEKYFLRKADEIRIQQKCFDTTTVSIKAHLPCYQAPYGIAQNKKPHMIGETVVLPSATDMIPTMFGAKCAQQLFIILLSNITVSLCSADTHISEVLEERLIETLRNVCQFR